MSRRGFSLLELTVTLCLAALVMGGAYYVLSTGQGSSSKGVVLLDELGKQIRLTEQLRRVLRTATSVVQTPKGDGSIYDITYVSKIDEEGPTLVTERARLELTTLENGGLAAVFLREHQKPVRYNFLDMMMDIDVGTGNATIRFTSRRSTTSLQLACANLLPSGIPLDPVQRPGPLPSPPAGPTSFSGPQLSPQSAGQSPGGGPIAPQSMPRGPIAPQSNPAGPPGPPPGPVAARGIGPASAAGATPITAKSPAAGLTPTSASAAGAGVTPTSARGPEDLAGATPASAAGPVALAGNPGPTPSSASAGGFANPSAPPETATPDERQPSRPGLPPIRQGRPGDSARKPPRALPPVGWTGLTPGRTATPAAATPAAAMARPPAPKALKPSSATAAAATSARPATTRIPGDEVQPLAGGTIDEPF